jgi:hypothetical protein
MTSEREESGAAAESVAHAAALPPNYFELYRLAVEMADRVSARRGIANSFFLSVNTAVAALLGSGDLRWYVAVSGMAFAVTWWALLKSYRELNNAKFDIILAMEERLPVRVYGDEWTRLKRDNHQEQRARKRRDVIRAWFAGYRELGQVERTVPAVFAAIYLAELIRQAC